MEHAFLTKNKVNEHGSSLSLASHTPRRREGGRRKFYMAR